MKTINVNGEVYTKVAPNALITSVSLLNDQYGERVSIEICEQETDKDQTAPKLKLAPGQHIAIIILDD